MPMSRNSKTHPAPNTLPSSPAKLLRELSTKLKLMSLKLVCVEKLVRKKSRG